MPANARHGAGCDPLSPACGSDAPDGGDHGQHPHHELAATVSDARETRIALAPWLVPGSM
jgi:hypothetical protein